MFNKTIIASAVLFATVASANVEVPITGNVESKCVIVTDTPGVYANPTTDLLSTDLSDGGIPAIIRYDIIEENAYKAKISTPIEFTSSPVLNDVLDFSGTTSVKEVSDAAMADFETNKIEWENVTEFDLTIAGSVWFQPDSQVRYGFGKSFPGGEYRASILAECIAK